MQSQAVKHRAIRVVRPWPFLVASAPREGLTEAARRVIERTRGAWMQRAS